MSGRVIVCYPYNAHPERISSNVERLTSNVQRRTFNIELLQSLVSSPKQKTKFFVRIRPEARKPAKVKAVGMQGVKERACELL